MAMVNSWFRSEYVGSNRHSFWQYYYEIEFSSNVPAAISFPMTYTQYGAGTLTDRNGNRTTYTRSSPITRTITIPADNPSSTVVVPCNEYSQMNVSGGGNIRSYVGYSDYYIPSSDGDNYTLYNTIDDSWTFTAPSISGYTFVGWYTIDRDYLVSSGDSYTLPSEKTKFTQLISSNATVTWRELYDAAHYYEYEYSSERIEPGSSKTRTHSYNRNMVRLVYAQATYSVRFNANGGTGSMPDQVFEMGESKSLSLNEFVRTGYSFSGWATSETGSKVYDDGQTVKDLTTISGSIVNLYAVWIANKTTVTYDPNGGYVLPDSEEKTPSAQYGSLPRPMPPSFQQTFVSWQDEQGNVITETSIVPASDITLTAQWTEYAETVKVLLSTVGTVSPNIINAVIGEPIGSLPTPVRAGYRFLGWFTAVSEGTQITESTIVPNYDFTIFAQWEGVPYTLTFNANGGSVSPSSKSVKFGGIYGELPVPVYAGRIFDGWFTMASGGIKVDDATVVQSDDTIYAHWHIPQVCDWIAVTAS